MKEKTRKVVTLLITIIMASSILGYAIGWIGRAIDTNQNSENNKIVNYIIHEKINNQTKSLLIRNGFTIAEFYYNNDTNYQIIQYVKSLPQNFPTLDGKTQIISSMIDNSPEEKLILYSMKGENELTNLTVENIKDSLCPLLYSTSVECVNLTS